MFFPTDVWEVEVRQTPTPRVCPEVMTDEG